MSIFQSMKELDIGSALVIVANTVTAMIFMVV